MSTQPNPPSRHADPDLTTEDLCRAPDGAGAAAGAHARYRALRSHARGGLGEVFVAEDRELHREVALKEIQARHADDADSRGRFLLEAEITGQLEHPGIVPVYGLGIYADGRPFYAMRFIKGDSLKEAVTAFHAADQPVHTLRQLLGRFVTVCNAVAYAHSRGILHRDLKPANLMLGKYGETLVVDWGLAKPIGLPEPAAEDTEAALRPTSGSSVVETAAGVALGTPAYMSPEQAAGRLDDLGPAFDIYSLGATLYVLLAGRPPFNGTDLASLLEVVRGGAFAPPRQVNPATPPALDAICRKGMALRPEDRYPSALALAADVERWLADEPVAAYPEPWPTRAGRWLKCHKPLVAATAALLVTATAALAVSTLLIAREQQQTRAALEDVKQARTAEAEEKQRTVASLYVRNVALADRYWRDGAIYEAADLLRECPKELRGWEWHYLEGQLRGNSARVIDHRGFPWAAFNRDVTLLATAAIRFKGQDEITVWEAAGGKRLWRQTRDSAAGFVAAWRPDGRALCLQPRGQRSGAPRETRKSG